MNKSNNVLSVVVRPTPLRPVLSAALLIGVMTLGACAPRVDTRGNQLHPEDIPNVHAGETTRNQVLDLFGSPSSQGEFGTETWYYISETTETTAFLAPEVISRQVLAIEFDEAGVVSSVKQYDETNGEVVELAPGETPTAGNKLNFIQQMLSNLGRFNKK
ncbi:MAG TPA: outer membrane protein assembly factor BamE [Magnetovibrio sp.]